MIVLIIEDTRYIQVQGMQRGQHTHNYICQRCANVQIGSKGGGELSVYVCEKDVLGSLVREGLSDKVMVGLRPE